MLGMYGKLSAYSNRSTTSEIDARRLNFSSEANITAGNVTSVSLSNPAWVRSSDYSVVGKADDTSERTPAPAKIVSFPGLSASRTAAGMSNARLCSQSTQLEVVTRVHLMGQQCSRTCF